MYNIHKQEPCRSAFTQTAPAASNLKSSHYLTFGSQLLQVHPWMYWPLCLMSPLRTGSYSQTVLGVRHDNICILTSHLFTSKCSLLSFYTSIFPHLINSKLGNSLPFPLFDTTPKHPSLVSSWAVLHSDPRCCITLGSNTTLSLLTVPPLSKGWFREGSPVTDPCGSPGTDPGGSCLVFKVYNWCSLPTIVLLCSSVFMEIRLG